MSYLYYGGSEIRTVLYNILYAISSFSASERKGDRGSSRRRQVRLAGVLAKEEAETERGEQGCPFQISVLRG